MEFIDCYKCWKLEGYGEEFSFEDFDIDGEVEDGEQGFIWMFFFIIWLSLYSKFYKGMVLYSLQKFVEFVKRQLRFQCLFMLVWFVFGEFKEKYKQSGGSVGVLEELENVFSLVEEFCFGILDKLMVYLVE